ncbi:MAG: hypothetical protein HFH08_00290 [Bacilli bacterium]|nr:hypothetical protein [Bacilli bacterium]
MIKKVKENEYVKLVIELLENRKTRALVKLALWGFFFLLIFSIFDVRGTHTPTKDTLSSKEEWKTMLNYKSEITFTINEETYILNSVRNGSYEKLKIGEDVYYLEQDYLYHLEGYNKKFIKETSLLGYDLLKLRPDFLNEILLNSKLEYTTNYEDSKLVKKGYSINTAKFVELYHQSIITDDSFVTIEVMEKNNQIVQIELDLKEMQKYSQTIIQVYKIKIIYSDIGKVSKEEVE